LVFDVAFLPVGEQLPFTFEKFGSLTHGNSLGSAFLDKKLSGPGRSIGQTVVTIKCRPCEVSHNA
jgi:hypothetical protein